MHSVAVKFALKCLYSAILILMCRDKSSRAFSSYDFYTGRHSPTLTFIWEISKLKFEILKFWNSSLFLFDSYFVHFCRYLDFFPIFTKRVRWYINPESKQTSCQVNMAEEWTWIISFSYGDRWTSPKSFPKV